MSEEMSRLIERLEKTTGPDRQLDSAIADSIIGKERKAFGSDARYTASIDAALTLVPKDKWWSVTSHPVCATVGNADCTIPPDRYQIGGATPAIALCIAALRARMEQQT